tara:strand:+ start:209 stop:514 length:306 start_codon:yes stop_codon:yes gene_type:complete
MKTIVINGHKKTDKIMQIMDIYKEYVPIFYNSENYKYNIITAIYSHPEYHDDFLGFVLFARRMGIDTEDIRGTLMHDIGGLIREDDCFLPRVSGYSEHLNN